MIVDKTRSMAYEERDERDFHITIFGATGFTGKYVVQEVARSAARDIKWAVAGRNRDKLEQVVAEASNELGQDLSEIVGIIVADLEDEMSLRNMCIRSKIILNCVGPYFLYGEPVVKACVENGCHHLDVSGEPMFLEKMQLDYHQKAQEAQVHVIGACGFDSVLADMGVIFTKGMFKDAGELCHAESYLTINAGPQGAKMHYGTYQSVIYGLGNFYDGKLKEMRKLLFPQPMPKFGPKQEIKGPIFYSDKMRKWTVPFNGSDPSVVRRSQRVRYEQHGEKAVQYAAYFNLPSLMTLLMTMFFGFWLVLLAQFRRGRKLLERYPGFFSAGLASHDGPTKQQMEGTSFCMTVYGSGFSKDAIDSGTLPSKPDMEIVTRISGPEPGYVATPIIMVQAALVILDEPQHFKNRGGVFTPALAFTGTSYINRLHDHGIQFNIVSTPKSSN